MLLSVTQAAERLGIDVSRVRLLCAQGRFEGAQKVGRNWIIPETALDTLEISPVGRPGRPTKRIKEELMSNDIEWSAIVPLLGTMSDADIADKFGIHEQTAYRRRKQLKIPSFLGIDWSEIDPLLGTVTDMEVGIKFRIHKGSVARRRKELKIPAFRARKDWSEMDPLLGTMTDREIEIRFGTDRTTISARRRKLKIPSYQKQIDWGEIDQYLGTMSDMEVGTKFGIDITTIANRRRKFKIPTYRQASRTHSKINNPGEV